MGRKPKLSTKEKVYICEQYLNREKSVRELVNDFNIDKKWYYVKNSDTFN